MSDYSIITLCIYAVLFVGSVVSYHYFSRTTAKQDENPDQQTEIPSEPQHGGYIIGETLAAHGISCIFTLCGGHISPILQGAKDCGLKIVDVRDERSAAFGADAASRMTGEPGVVAVTAGPGITNCITALVNAREAQQPVVVLGGATATVLRGRGALQDIDQMALMKPVVKWSVRVGKVKDIQPILKRALATAVEGVPGPVFVELAVDLLYPEVIVREWYMKESGISKMTGLVGMVAKLGIDAYLWHQFHMPSLFKCRVVTQIPNGGSNRQVHKVARSLHRAERPILVIGNQTMVNLTPDQADELARAVKALGLPTFLGGSARGLLGRYSDIQFRHKRTNAMKEADFVLVAGFPFDFRMGYGQKINRKATVVAVNLDPAALTKNRRPSHAIRAHPGHFLQRLAAATEASSPDRSEWFAILRERETMRDAEIAATAPSGTLIDPVHLFGCVEKKLTDDSIIIVDGGDFVATGSYILRPRKPLSWLDPGVFGTLGVGGGFCVGAASSRPDAQVWLFYGDGSSAYSLAEFDTCRRLGFAPICVVGNNASWQQITRDQVKLLGTDVGTVLRRTDYHKVAEGYGGKGLLLTDPANTDEILDEAIRLSKEGHSVCINVHLADSDFREGSISI